MPSKKDGVKPSKEFNVREHLKRPLLEVYKKKVWNIATRESLEVPSTILNESLASVVEDLPQEGPIPMNEYSCIYPYSSVGMVVSQQ